MTLKTLLKALDTKEEIFLECEKWDLPRKVSDGSKAVLGMLNERELSAQVHSARHMDSGWWFVEVEP